MLPELIAVVPPGAVDVDHGVSLIAHGAIHLPLSSCAGLPQPLRAASCAPLRQRAVGIGMVVSHDLHHASSDPGLCLCLGLCCFQKALSQAG